MHPERMQLAEYEGAVELIESFNGPKPCDLTPLDGLKLATSYYGPCDDGPTLS